VKTLQATFEPDARPVYGVIWAGQREPLLDYDDLGEAHRVASVVGGRVAVRFEARTGWIEL
jgi:hypothetical protein